MKKYLLWIAVLFFGVVGSTSAFSVQVQNLYGIGLDWSSSFGWDTNIDTSVNFANNPQISNIYQVNIFEILAVNSWQWSTAIWKYWFWSGDWVFSVFNSTAGCRYWWACYFGSFLPLVHSFTWEVPLVTNTLPPSSMLQHDRDSVRVFTTGNIYSSVLTSPYNMYRWSSNENDVVFPKYTSLWWTDFESVNVYLPDSNYPAYNFDIAWKESHRRWPDYTYSTIDCGYKGNNFCHNPTFETTTTSVLTKDVLLQRSQVKSFQFQRVSYIKRWSWIDNASRPYTFLGVLSWNKVEFNVFSCYQWNLEVQDWCTEVLHGITQEIFGVNYPKMYWSSCWTTISSETGALLGQALFWNNSLYQCGTPSTSLWNYFSRIDFEWQKLYVASADIPWFAEQNAIHFDVLDEYNLANDYTWRYTSGYDSQVLHNELASCSWHYNDPAYPWCFIVKVSSWYDPFSLSPLAPSPDKILLQEALANSWKRAELYNNCQNLEYFRDHQFVCENVAVWVEESNYEWSGFSIKSEKLKTFTCQSEFYASSTEDFNLTLGMIPFVWDIFDKLNIWNYSLTRPFACIEWAINYARSESTSSSLTLTWTSIITLSESAKTKWDWFFNLLLIIPALVLIKKSWAIF